MKIILWIGVALLVLVAGFFLLNNHIYTEKQGDKVAQPGYDNVAYWIDGTSVRLQDGIAETAIPGSNAVITTRIFGNEAEGDLNKDGVSDIAFIITQNSGGSGTFYYAIAALKTDDGYQGLNGILLGDRISPQSTEIRDGDVIVNYADRKADEPMSATPSVGMSKTLYVENAQLVEETGTGDATENMKYVHVQESPRVEFMDGEFTCGSVPTIIEQREVNGRAYCIATSSEGAAGSTYTTYAYSTQIKDKVATITFVLRIPQCLNYDEPEQSACKNEQEAFDVDAYADRVVSNITIE